MEEGVEQPSQRPLHHTLPIYRSRTIPFKLLMNAVWHRFLKPFYRKEPISSFILTVGAVDVALGSLGSYSSLLLLGMGTMTGAIALRWWQSQRADNHRPQESLPEYYLAPGVTSEPLPRLNPSKHRR